MAKAVYYPTQLTDELAAETRKSFDEIVAGVAAPSEAAAPRNAPKQNRYITVLVNMPHVKKYGKGPTMSLTYGCSFVVVVGDHVLCPPTRLNPKWTRGIVTDLEANGYRGRVKYVAPLGGEKKGDGSK